VILARGLLEFITDILVAVLLLVGFAVAGLQATPTELWTPATALLVTAALGLGVGFVNAVVTVFVRSWDRLYAQLTRALYFCSGIFYVPGMMPGWARDLLAWNPLLHAIDWFRSGFFETYQPNWLDRPYLVLAATVAVLAGLAVHSALRRKLSEPP
jgi:capsular polysaccharide transport system permease protein